VAGGAVLKHQLLPESLPLITQPRVERPSASTVQEALQAMQVQINQAEFMSLSVTASLNALLLSTQQMICFND
jgi:hypothetical protein